MRICDFNRLCNVIGQERQLPDDVIVDGIVDQTFGIEVSKQFGDLSRRIPLSTACKDQLCPDKRRRLVGVAAIAPVRTPGDLD